MSGAVARLAHSRAAAWTAFAVVHVVLSVIGLTSPSMPLGDVTIVYRAWVEQGLHTGVWPGVDEPWVYPIAALAPMIAAHAFGASAYVVTWLVLVLALDAALFALLTGVRGPNDLCAAWWWLALLALLGPVALGRIDAIVVPFALAGTLLATRRPAVAAALLAVAAWIKVWPAAVLAALVIVVRERARMVAAALATSVLVVLVPVLCGGLPHLASFLTTQSGRGLQIEAPIATPWMWLAAAGRGTVAYDPVILTFQVSGPGTDAASAITTPLLVLAIVVVLGLGMLALRAGADVRELLPVLVLGLVTGLIAFNKVGSPQFMTWLAVPVVAALSSGVRTRTRVPVVLSLVLAGLTQTIYPYLYPGVFGLQPAMLVVLTVRNALVVALFAWALARAVVLARGPHGEGVRGAPARVWSTRGGSNERSGR